jgi:hypothetical protein
MKENIPTITRIMKELTDIKDQFTSKASQDQMNDIIYDLADMRDIMDY